MVSYRTLDFVFYEFFGIELVEWDATLCKAFTWTDDDVL